MAGNISLLIAGSRTFHDEAYLNDELVGFVRMYGRPDLVLCGEARGADLMGKIWAIKQGIMVQSFPPQWDLYGKSAGFRRNEEMVQQASHAIIFWDWKSKGSKHTIDLCVKKGIPHKVVRFFDDRSEAT